MTVPAIPSPQSAFRRHAWPIAIAFVLIASAASNILVMFVAKGDPAFAVEPDYYAKAVDWDATMAQSSKNTALGWQVSGAMSLSQAEQVGKVTLTLQDASGSPLTGASVEVEAMHNARSADRRTLALVPMQPGVYWAPIDARRPGEWELRVKATRGGDVFTHSLRVDAR